MTKAKVATSTIGMIFECGPQGADKQVCEYLAKHIRPEIEIKSVTLDNKDNLLRDAGKAAQRLFSEGCSTVLVIWDLRPAWPDKKKKPCRHDERETVLKRMTEAGIDVEASLVVPICIEQELESWLIANENAVSAVLSTAAHPYTAKKVKSPDNVAQPKAAMINHFSERGWRYDDKVDAIRVLRAADIDLKRLRRSVSFARFETKLLAS